MKTRQVIFIAICVLISASLGILTIIMPTEKTTENKPMAAAPVLLKDGQPNTEVFSEFEAFFNEHVALRNEMVFADAFVQTKVFQTSNIASVLYGKDGWLFYGSTLPDFNGTGLLGSRALQNIAHNLELMQSYLNDADILFTVAIPPNKNTLYPENMPYYDSLAIAEVHNMDLLTPILSEKDIHYTDLFELFKGEEKVLYLKQDSHWSMEGAQKAFAALMEDLGAEHRTYTETEIVWDYDGDLGKMLYSFFGQPEETVSFRDLTGEYEFKSEAKETDAGWIVTENENGRGTLLMFRDSFANTLIPYFSNEFEAAYYTKGQPFALERYVNEYAPDCVIYEKVERNVADLITHPPIFTAPKAETPETISIYDKGGQAEIAVSENDPNYYRISGSIDAKLLTDTAEIVVSVEDVMYRAFHVNENEFTLYLPKAMFTENLLQVDVFTAEDGVYRRVYSKATGIR